MSKHDIDLFIEDEIKLLYEIQSYLNELTQKKHKVIKVAKTHNGNYLITIKNSIELEVVRVAQISFDFTIADIYKKASEINSYTLDEVMEQYIRERLAEELSYIIDHLDDYIPENEEEFRGFINSN